MGQTNQENQSSQESVVRRVKIHRMVENRLKSYASASVSVNHLQKRTRRKAIRHREARMKPESPLAPPHAAERKCESGQTKHHQSLSTLEGRSHCASPLSSVNHTAVHMSTMTCRMCALVTSLLPPTGMHNLNANPRSNKLATKTSYLRTTHCNGQLMPFHLWGQSLGHHISSPGPYHDPLRGDHRCWPCRRQHRNPLLQLR